MDPVPQPFDLEEQVMNDSCGLREALGIQGESCDGPDCIYWRALSHLGLPLQEGCSLEHADVLDDPELLKWLLTVKERIEGTRPPGETGTAG